MGLPLFEIMTSFINRENWLELLRNLDLKDNSETFDALIQAYQEESRAYHNLQHLNECLEKLDWAKSQLSTFDFDRIALALWFHDAVYNPKANNNEAKSNDWVQAFLKDAQASKELKINVQTYIMSTLHQSKPNDKNAQLMVDIDLSILGANQTRFAEYEKQIRQEYRWVPWFLYKKRRKTVLKHFLAMKSIYSIDFFKDMFEKQARANLQQSIVALR